MIMKNVKNSRLDFKDIIQKSKSSQSTKYLMAQLNKLKAAIAEARNTGATDRYLTDLEYSGLAAIRTDLLLNKQNEALAAQDVLNQLAEKYTREYEKDYGLHDFRIKNLERKLYAATDAELETMVNNKEYLFDDVNMANAFTTVLNDRGLDELLAVAKTELKSSDYDKPCLRTDEGKLLKEKLELIVPGSMDILLRDETGKQYGVSVDELWEQENADEEAVDE